MTKRMFCLSLMLLLSAWEPGRSAPLIQGLVNVAAIDATIVVDMRYATADNFTGRKVYPHAVCVLRAETARKLAAANADFRKLGLRIKVWDAYRPPNVQEIFWRLVPDERYVANPAAGGSRHSRGGAVDVTLVDGSGRELVMPSGFDDFSPAAARGNGATGKEAAHNLACLTEIMVRHGFRTIDSEWWHFEDSDAESFEMVDVSLDRFLADETTPLSLLNPEICQALVVSSTGPARHQAALALWERRGGAWRRTAPDFAVVVGRNGFAAPGEKREGDGKSPSGVFALGSAFGYAPAVRTALPYRQATGEDYWVDDPLSPLYNRWVRGAPDAASCERLRRDDDLYKYGVVVEYNTTPVVPHLGSAIFVHLWPGPDSPTAGCVAMPEDAMLRLLAWLDPTKNPVIVMGKLSQ